MVEKAFILRVIQMRQDWSAFCKKGEELHMEFGEALDLPFADLILDMMGFPQDNTTQMREMLGSAAHTHPNTYCRDYLFDFFWHETDNLTAEQVYEKLSEFLREVEEYRNK